MAKPKAKTPKVPTLFHTGHLYMIAETNIGGVGIFTYRHLMGISLYLAVRPPKARPPEHNCSELNKLDQRQRTPGAAGSASLSQLTVWWGDSRLGERGCSAGPLDKSGPSFSHCFHVASARLVGRAPEGHDVTPDDELAQLDACDVAHPERVPLALAPPAGRAWIDVR